MWTRDALQPQTLAPLRAGGAGTPAPSSTPGTPNGGAFSAALQQAKTGTQTAPSPNTSATGPSGNSAARHTIANGETLIGVVRKQAQAQGLKLSNTEQFRLAQELASANQISDADRVYPGQTVELSNLRAQLQSLQSVQAVQAMHGANTRTAGAMAQTSPALASTPVALTKPLNSPLGYDVRSRHFTQAANRVSPTSGVHMANSGAHPVLERTLDRAVAKGFIPAAEKTAVYDKIVQMAGNHRFSPDDFARMTLMESDGMNPRASNERCHGIIQFCDGPARGAASAGYGANPKAILDLSVHQQLGLVDRYFDDVGLESQGPAGLEDLYLSVLNPASRAQSQANAPLNIQGQQARALHVGSDSTAPITRQSIRKGLLENAAARLGQMLPNGLRLQAQRAQQYVQNTAP